MKSDAEPVKENILTQSERRKALGLDQINFEVPAALKHRVEMAAAHARINIKEVGRQLFADWSDKILNSQPVVSAEAAARADGKKRPQASSDPAARKPDRMSGERSSNSKNS